MPDIPSANDQLAVQLSQGWSPYQAKSGVLPGPDLVAGVVFGLGMALVSFVWTPLPDFQVPSDTTGTLGYEAISNSQRFCDVWSAEQFPLSIVYKELIPIIIAAALCDPQWVSQQVKLLCDNKSVVTVLMSGTSLDQQLIATCHSFAFTASLIHG